MKNTDRIMVLNVNILEFYKSEVKIESVSVCRSFSETLSSGSVGCQSVP